MLFSAVFTPLIRLTNGVANWVLKQLGIEAVDELSSARSPQELVSLVRTSARQGSLDPATADLVDRSAAVRRAQRRRVRDPRSKVKSLEADDTVADLLEMVRTTGFFFPVTRGDLDRTIGVVHLKQVFEIPHERRVGGTRSARSRKLPVVPSHPRRGR